ncbi:nascent polypeptide-associated complex subunit alpha-like protein-like isoform 2 [Hibiscus syriacus]|uniref:Nascent polypeptide-associated complex subunit alpha-like protein-like isoform 2 n=1 Tax=Hibiscus syriacus TaxID=106335 RepID=A0A6A2YRC2_HIBSY|nr:uncharacterized protein LOC120158020 [Hibiscus syriacus]KAE8681909.1 nascent polypeptide-associated complex subunit alpha-like protein-like isoform 2 [Hibiscus syriacus]
MGKTEEQQRLSSNVSNEVSVEESNASISSLSFRFVACGSRNTRIGLRCFVVVMFALALFLSALFWLTPFLHSSDRSDLDLDSRFKDHDIVASFKVGKPVSFLGDNIVQLENDIFDEIGFPTSKVVILSLKPLNVPNVTKVVFGVDPNARYSKISPTAESLTRSSFEYLVTHRSSLRLTKSLFGDSYFLDVLKFPGGITVIPPQSAFLLQKVQIRFNFTLNFSIYQIQLNFDDLRSQLKAGLHLSTYENLYIILSNSKGSTAAPPTTVQSSVLLAVGNNPSIPRLKQLAQTITGSHSRNLGLNNTVFGRVKEVRLSSIPKHSVHGGDGSSNSSSPSPAPSPHPLRNNHHHHRHHHHHHHHHGDDLAPAVPPATSAKKGAASAPEVYSPAPETISPASQLSNKANPPGFHHRNKRSKGKTREESNVAPVATPKISPHHSPVPPNGHPSAPAPKLKLRPVSYLTPTSSPLPNVAFGHVKPSSKSEPNKEVPDRTPSVPPSALATLRLPTMQWLVSPLLVITILYL